MRQINMDFEYDEVPYSAEVSGDDIRITERANGVAVDIAYGHIRNGIVCMKPRIIGSALRGDPIAFACMAIQEEINEEEQVYGKLGTWD